jgi:hypothetical protein
MRHIRLLDFRTVIFFCYQTIGILNIRLEHPETIRQSDIRSRPQSIRPDIGLTENYWLPTSGDEYYVGRGVSTESIT